VVRDDVRAGEQRPTRFCFQARAEAGFRRKQHLAESCSHDRGRRLSVRGRTRFSHDRWLAFGTCVAGLGGTGAAAYWIYTLEANTAAGFWNLPGYACVGLVGLGIVLMVIGFFAPARLSDPTLEQHGGAGSTNLQAGRDITLKDGPE
jgi:hypothetical protein